MMMTTRLLCCLAIRVFFYGVASTQNHYRGRPSGENYARVVGRVVNYGFRCFFVSAIAEQMIFHNSYRFVDL